MFHRRVKKNRDATVFKQKNGSLQFKSMHKENIKNYLQKINLKLPREKETSKNF